MLNPCPSFWSTVPTGATLCYKCYNTGWRQKARGGNGRPPDFERQANTTQGDNNMQTIEEDVREGENQVQPSNLQQILQSDDLLDNKPPGELDTFDGSRSIDIDDFGECADDTGDVDLGDDDFFPEMPSSSKRRRCAEQLRASRQRRRDKGMSVNGELDSNNSHYYERDCPQKTIYCQYSDSPDPRGQRQPTPALRLHPTFPNRGSPNTILIHEDSADSPSAVLHSSQADAHGLPPLS